MPSAHSDTFARDRLPAPELQPEFLFELPELTFPEQMNCATELLDRHVIEGRGDRVCVRAPGLTWTYRDLKDKADRIAHVLVNEMGLVPGNRVLLRAPNNPMLAACWFAVIKAGGIAVATMPLLRAKELKAIIDIGQVSHALCDAGVADELREAALACPGMRRIRHFNYDGPDSLERAMERFSDPFDNLDTAADDICLLGFTSGTTGVPKATIHFHRDILAICRCWPPHVLRAVPDDVFIGSPPLAFTFGLGGLLLFPMSIGASTVLLEKCGPPQLLDGDQGIRSHRAVHRANVVPDIGGAQRGAAQDTAAQMRLGRRGAAGIDAHAVERGDRDRTDRRHRRDRDAAHLHFGR